jgi:hypothetical protein
LGGLGVVVVFVVFVGHLATVLEVYSCMCFES